MRKFVSREVDMLNGSILKGLVIFLLPLMASNFLQVLYNAADMMVLGRFVGTVALSSVGATSATYHLIVNIFIGLSAGVSVLVSQQFGGEKYKELSETVHTAGALSIIIGLFVGALGFTVSPWFLHIIKTPAESLEGAILYLRIMFLGLPALITYNFGASILRAVGDNRRPFIFLSISGVLNVILNLVFVVVFEMSIAGVALATIISQYLSAVLVWMCLFKTPSIYRFEIKQMRIHKNSLLGILKIGIPSGIQSAMFSLSNLIMQSAFNSFGYVYVAASTACTNIENLICTAASSVSQSSMVYAGQNIGAGNLKRVKKLYFYSSLVTVFITTVLGVITIAFAGPLVSIFDTNPEVIKIGIQRLFVLALFYGLFGIYDNSFALIRGMGYSLIPMLGSVFGICATRVIWVLTVFPLFETYTMLLIIYPISWGVSAVIEGILFFVYFGKTKKRMQAQ